MIPKSTSDINFPDIISLNLLENVTGTIVGFWTPEIFHGVSVAGYHHHFISNDHTFGHVMDFVIKKGLLKLGPLINWINVSLSRIIISLC